jgi:hypothetical protein
VAIVSISEAFGARAASANDEGQRHYTLAFTVVVNDLVTDALAVRNAFMAHPNGFTLRSGYAAGASADAGALCRSIEAKEKEAPFVWEVVAEFDTKQSKSGEENEDPLDRPTLFNWGRKEDSTVLTIDRRGNPVVASTGEPFDPAVPARASSITLTIEKNKATFDPVFALTFQDAVNAEGFLGFAPGQVQCGSITASEQNEKGILYYKVSYPFEIHDRGFQPRPMDRACAYLADDGQLAEFKDRNGITRTGPQPLNGFGKPLLQPGQTARGCANPTFAYKAHVAAFPVSDVDLTVSIVEDPANFGGLPCIVTCGQEQMKVTATGTLFALFTLTVVRGYNGTTAAAHPAGAEIATKPVYLQFEQFEFKSFKGLKLP